MRTSIVILALLAIAALTAAYLEYDEAEDLRAKNAVAEQEITDARSKTEDALTRSNAAVEAAQAGAALQISAIRAEAASQISAIRRKTTADEARAAALLMTQERRLATAFPGLRYLQPGPNAMNLQYIESLEVSGSSLSVKLVNHTSLEIKPNYSIQFLNEYGFFTDVCSESWVFDRIKPGETRVTSYNLQSSFGAAVYFLPQLR